MKYIQSYFIWNKEVKMLNIKEEHKRFCHKVKENECYTIEDVESAVHAKLYIKAKKDLYICKIDNGIITKSRKCDFLSKSNICTNFIELKGANINEAYDQITKTVEYLQNDDKYCILIKNAKVYAIIVSPLRQIIPKGGDKRLRELSCRLASLNLNNKISDITKYIKYVKVTNTKKLSIKENRIECSGKAPMEIE